MPPGLWLTILQLGATRSRMEHLAPPLTTMGVRWRGKKWTPRWMCSGPPGDRGKNRWIPLLGKTWLGTVESERTRSTWSGNTSSASSRYRIGRRRVNHPTRHRLKPEWISQFSTGLSMCTTATGCCTQTRMQSHGRGTAMLRTAVTNRRTTPPCPARCGRPASRLPSPVRWPRRSWF